MLKYRLRQMEALFHRLAAARRAGAAPGPGQLQTAQDVIDVLQEQVEALRQEPWLDPVERARAIGYLAGQARRAIETGTLAARLEVMERVLKQRDGEGS